MLLNLQYSKCILMVAQHASLHIHARWKCPIKFSISLFCSSSYIAHAHAQHTHTHTHVHARTPTFISMVDRQWLEHQHNKQRPHHLFPTPQDGNVQRLTSVIFRTQISQNITQTTAIYLFSSAHPSSRWCRISTGGVLTRRWHHRRIWLIRMDPSPWKLWVSYKFCCPLFSLKLYWSWKTDERTSVIYNLARVLWALHHQIVETGGKYGVVAVMDTVYRCKHPHECLQITIYIYRFLIVFFSSLPLFLLPFFLFSKTCCSTERFDRRRSRTQSSRFPSPPTRASSPFTQGRHWMIWMICILSFTCLIIFEAKPQPFFFL